ncbi:sensor histidine kinase [Acinetobacter sp. MD2(2019)]|uniref:sensor histidine kinase n=1 Tax=Acinetobacter sp. MD2(2019) TaxID=2605273 RepID=UPI002D1F37C8|nr:histidine kinase [Acinetobacter sp. MD2(2019)]MEB3754457.1 histidine kinase [Acinetobacter sp. MD2(2019)]
MWSWRLSKIKKSIAKPDPFADGQRLYAKPSSKAVRQEQSAYFFTKIGRWQYLIELFLASAVLSVLIALAEAQTWQALSVARICEILLYFYWVEVVFAWIVDRYQSQLNRLSHVAALSVGVLILQSIIVCTTLFLNGLSILSHHHAASAWSFENLWRGLPLHLSYGLLLSIFCLRYLYIRDQWVKQQHSELQARIQAMQARIQPHFLFNSLNSVVSLIATDPDKAEDMLINLSRLFRASLQELKLVPLHEELALCQHYMAIEQMRLGERLDMDWRLPALPLLYGIQIPLLSLQPLLENSIFHGVEKMSGACKISLLVEVLEQQVNIVISNPYQPKQQEQRQGHGLALENVKQRLRAYYGYAADVRFFAVDGIFTTVVRFPSKINLKS